MDIASKLMQGARAGGPPKDVEPSELARRLMDTKRPSDVLPFVRKDEDGNALCEYRMTILTQDEIDACWANAEQYTRRVFKSKLGANDEEINMIRREAWAEVYENAKLVEVLYTAMRDKDDVNKRVWTAPQEIRKLLTQDECATLFRSYEETQFMWGPLWRMLTADEIDAWIEKLTEGASNYPLGHLGQGALVQLIASLAFQLKNLKSDTGSSGSPSEPTASESSPSEAE
jgi:hypothetical protein